MKILNQPVSAMYIWAIALLSVLAAISSYALHALPLPLILAVAIAGIIEILIRKLYLKHAFKIPYSGLITGLIIGSVAPINAPLPLILIASVIAVVSKFFIQFKNSNIFNPATLGLVIALPIFGLGDEWWVASNYNIYGIAITLTPILIILAYEARRLPTALSFIGASVMLALVMGMGSQLSLTAIAALLFGINYFFAFVMLVEPKTSPHNNYAQVAYGLSLAVLYIAFALLRMPYPLLVVLLIGNLFYLLYRKYGKR
jgi:Na+-translocating ferredoxin:NAD+ oxidoreductase RnfD subunit